MWEGNCDTPVDLELVKLNTVGGRLYGREDGIRDRQDL